DLEPAQPSENAGSVWQCHRYRTIENGSSRRELCPLDELHGIASSGGPGRCSCTRSLATGTAVARCPRNDQTYDATDDRSDWSQVSLEVVPVTTSGDVASLIEPAKLWPRRLNWAGQASSMNMG